MKFRRDRKPLSNDQIVLLMLIAQSVIVLGLVIFNLIISSYLMLAVVMAYFMLSLANTALYFKTKSYNLWAFIFIVLGSVDILFLFFSGGNEGSGLLWSFLFPFLIFFLKGHKTGLYYSLGYFALLILIFLSSFFGFYKPFHPIPFYIVYFFVNLTATVFLFFNERNRFITTKLLEEGENRFRVLSEQSKAGIYIYQKGRFIKFNKTFTEITGYSEDELLKMNKILFAHSGYRDFFSQDRSNLLLDETPTNSYEIKIISKDGNEKWVENVTEKIVLGNESAIVGTMIDISDRKKTEENLLRKTGFQKLILDISADFLNSSPSVYDKNINQFMRKFGRYLGADRLFVYMNNYDHKDMELLEWYEKRENSISHHFPDIKTHLDRLLAYFSSNREIVVLPDDIDKLENINRADYEKLVSEKGNVLLIPMLKDNNVRGLIGIVSLFNRIEADSEIKKLLAVISNMLTDVSEKNRLDIELSETLTKMESLNYTKDKLFSIIAHDLRSPFNSFIGFTDLMTDKNGDMSIDDMRKYSKLLNELAKSSFELLENLLEWSRLQRGILKMEKSRVIVKEFIIDALSSYEDKVNKKSHKVVVNVDDNILAHFDKRMIETVVRNIFANAVKFTRDNGSIYVKAVVKDDNQLEISIEDTGIGIPESIIGDLFTINDRKCRTGLNGEKSSGIGLMLCKEFVDLHKGDIKVESKVDFGSKFTILLPQD